MEEKVRLILAGVGGGVDPGGHLIVVERMDGAPFITAEIAIGKA